MLNVVVLMGRLTADPEVKTTASGISVCSFSVAVDRNYSSQTAERQTDFINVVAWRNNADFVAKYFRKGQMIAVQGSLQSRKYEDKSGQKRTAFEVVADRCNFCGSKAESGGEYAGGDYVPAAPAYSNSAPADFAQIVDGEDDLPF